MAVHTLSRNPQLKLRGTVVKVKTASRKKKKFLLCILQVFLSSILLVQVFCLLFGKANFDDCINTSYEDNALPLFRIPVRIS